MRPATPHTTFLKDYAPFAYSIPRARLSFALDESATRVAADYDVEPRPGTPAGTPLLLDGQKLLLESLAIDGEPLPESAYALSKDHLTIRTPPGRPFRLSIVSLCNPAANTELSGLYLSNGMYCTQCEAEGFRRISFFPDRPDLMTAFDVRIEASAALPVLLSNGNPGRRGLLADGRHFAEWHDPFPKPCYLFALVAGDLDCLADEFVTADGRRVALGIHVEKGKVARCTWAMESLKRSMAWDEQQFGRLYDLEVFNIVAVSQFNMGAMENKGLNIFNDKYILADPETAADLDYANVEAIIAHEYFHNWTGNRITCRDWFQLCLKEGLTVYRDQEFSSDVRSRPVKRISDVRSLRARQFPEDGGPLAHPVRPDRYIEINNFYTATVYEKGAEICRMLALLIGHDKFRAGMDRYFARHDGQAVTIEDFLACIAEASGRDLAQFHRWYEQAGTPRVTAEGAYDAASRSYSLTIEQRTPPTPNQDEKRPLHMPLLVGLLGGDGRDLPLDLEGAGKERPELLELTAARQTFRFRNVPSRPVLSLNRGFSAPVLLASNAAPADELFAMAHDADRFNRWQAAQSRGLALLRERYRGQTAPGDVAVFAAALSRTIRDATQEPAFRALMLALPTEADIAAAIGRDVSAALVHAAHSETARSIGQILLPDLRALWEATADAAGDYRPDPRSAGRRALRYALLPYLVLAAPQEGEALAMAEFAAARHMSARMGVLSALVHTDAPSRDAALAAFHAWAAGDNLVLDKWFMLQAQAGDGARVRALLDDRDFTYLSPNRVHALLSSFVSANPAAFHASDGAGYAVVADGVIATDKVNPQVAARVATGFRSWRMFDATTRTHAETQLQRILAAPGLSRDCFEIVSRIAAAA